MKIRRICKLNYAYSNAGTGLFYKHMSKILLIMRNKYENFLDSSKSCGIIIFTLSAAFEEVLMAKPRPDNPKEKFLRESGALNTHPVTDALFSESDFFDPRDLVQVKYEMLRKVHMENEPVSNAVATFGFSRPSFYKISTDYQREGIAGLLPRKRGPRSGHKITEEVLGFIKEICTVEQPMSTSAVLQEVEKRFGIRVHRRSLERALHRYEKKTMQPSGKKTRESQ
jgi:transposase